MLRAKIGFLLKRFGYRLLGILTTLLLRTLRLIPVDWLTSICGAMMRRIGPWLPEHKVGQANLRAAFPEKSPEEIERILAGVWDNLGRVAAEFAHLDHLWDYDPSRPGTGHLLDSPLAEERMKQMRDDGKPALVFSAHCANWELPAVAANVYGVDSAVIFRAPNIDAVADAVTRMRGGIMGKLIRTGLDAPKRAAEALAAGSHVAMLVDQYSVRGVDVTFFGRPARTNPLLARLAQHYDCPIYGVHMVRHPNNKFQLHLTEPMQAKRGPDGQVDAAATMQMVNDVVESWVREHPEQWLWVHRRWR